MADPRFFDNKGPLSVAELSSHTGDAAVVRGDGSVSISDVAPLDAASENHISFLDNRKYIEAFEASAARACIVAPELADRAPDGMVLIVTPKPYRAYARIAHAFYPSAMASTGVHPSASIDPEADVSADAAVGANAVVEAGARIAAGAEIGAGAVVGRGVSVGEGSRVGANASLAYCEIGARCELHAGVRIGTRGFGFDMSAEGHLDVPQLGRVIIGDDVEVGANSTIDRGAGPDTLIGNGCKIDNLVQIGHNVRIGKGCVIIAQTGIAGSTVLEDFVVVAAQAGVAGHLRIGSGAQIGAKSGVMRDVEPGARIAGAPAVPAPQFFRQVAALEKLTKKKSE